MPLKKSLIRASVKSLPAATNSPLDGVEPVVTPGELLPANAPLVGGKVAELLPAAVTLDGVTASQDDEAFYTSATRVPVDPKLGKNSDEWRKWVREELKNVEKKRSKVSDETAKKYAKTYRNLEAMRDKNGAIPVSSLGGNAKTFYLNRAAVIYMATVKARAAISEIGKADDRISAAKSSGDTNAVARARSDKERALQDMLLAGHDLLRHPAGKAGQYIAAQTEFRADKKEYKKQPKAMRDLVFEKPVAPAVGAHKTAVLNGEIKTPSRHSDSKRVIASQLQKRYPNYRDLAFDLVSDKWKDFTAVASVIGCRPEEIVGIKFGLDKSNPEYLQFEIKGAKVMHDLKRKEKVTHGIEVRKFSIREKDSKAFDYLLELAKQRPQVVQAPTKGNGIPLADINGAFRNALNQAGKKFIKQRKDASIKLSLSPYCFRHQFACDLKIDNYSDKTIAITLGHLSTRTQQAYGHTKSGVKNQRELLVDEVSYKINEQTRTPLGPTPEIVMIPDPQPYIGRQPTPGNGRVIQAPSPAGWKPPAPPGSGSDFDFN